VPTVERGVRLLESTTRRLARTAEGRAYVERCRRILADVAEAERALADEAAAPRGPLRVTAPVLYGQLAVAPAIASFLRAHAEVSVELLLLDRVVNMVEEGIDVGVRIAQLEDSSMLAARVGQVRRVVVASPALLRRTGTLKHPRELADHPCVHFHGLDAAPVWRFAGDGRGLAVPIRGRFACNLAASAIDACAEGLGFGRFLSYQVEALVAAKKLRVVLRDFEPDPIPIHVVFAHAKLVSPRVRAFVDWLRANL